MMLLFYQNLGKICYAVAAADKEVHPLEHTKLKELVKKHWLDTAIVKGTCSSNAAYHIELVFNSLNNKNNLDAHTCFKDFVAYKNLHKHLFTTKIRRLILKTTSEIAHAYSGINKSELIMLAKLDIELKKP
ncbi:hypothetical protein ACFSQS_01915 [Gelatiniphilus marinus]|uniref:Uncharacterized protein n=2 Tax=Gelatiniphilus marinus TaxID=1759464 RepID=A0ABW5JPY6_9FLAO